MNTLQDSLIANHEQTPAELAADRALMKLMVDLLKYKYCTGTDFYSMGVVGNAEVDIPVMQDELIMLTGLGTDYPNNHLISYINQRLDLCYNRAYHLYKREMLGTNSVMVRDIIDDISDIIPEHCPWKLSELVWGNRAKKSAQAKTGLLSKLPNRK